MGSHSAQQPVEFAAAALPAAPANGGLAAGGEQLTFPYQADSDRSLLAQLDAPGNKRSPSRLGKALFGLEWPVESEAFGPHFDARSCAGCHVEAQPPVDRDQHKALPPVVRTLSRGARDRFGPQVSHRTRPGTAPRPVIRTEYKTLDGRFDDGTPYSLRKPVVRLDEDSNVGLGLRAPPVVFGWGLLEQVPDNLLLSLADPRDRDDDGVSGQAATVTGPDGVERLGRFGWKGEHASLRAQIAAALSADMGLSTSVERSVSCARCPAELGDGVLDSLESWLRHLGVFERRDRKDPRVLRGERLFGELRCNACHRLVLVTRPHREANLDHQIIWPYTDLLLHDMGEGLADPVADPESGDAPHAREWRTAPLWGLGAVAEQWPARGFLHDGRARTLLEAVLWHGGEAQASRRGVLALDASERASLVAFLESL